MMALARHQHIRRDRRMGSLLLMQSCAPTAPLPPPCRKPAKSVAGGQTQIGLAGQGPAPGHQLKLGQGCFQRSSSSCRDRGRMASAGQFPHFRVLILACLLSFQIVDRSPCPLTASIGPRRGCEGRPLYDSGFSIGEAFSHSPIRTLARSHPVFPSSKKVGPMLENRKPHQLLCKIHWPCAGCPECSLHLGIATSSRVRASTLPRSADRDTRRASAI